MKNEEYRIVTDVLISKCSEFIAPFYGEGYLLSGSKNFQLFTKTLFNPGRYQIVLIPLD